MSTEELSKTEEGQSRLTVGLDMILPCPFCGADPTISDIEPHVHVISLGDWKMPDHPGSTVIECGCGAGLIDDTREKVLRRWNTRASNAIELTGALKARPNDRRE